MKDLSTLLYHALQSIVYEKNGRFYIGHHGDTDCTEEVGEAMLQYQRKVRKQGPLNPLEKC
jgi:hypothetical protein